MNGFGYSLFFGKVVSLFAGFGEESVIELFNGVTSDSETITGSGIVKGGVESAIGTGVEPVSTQETTKEGSGGSSVSQYEEGEGVMRFKRKA